MSLKFPIFALISISLASSAIAQLSATKVEADLRRTADWQLAHPNKNQKREVGIRQWHIAPLYHGFIRLSNITGDAKYLAEVVRVGNLANWAPGNRPYHADDHAVGQAWIDIFNTDPSQTHRLQLIKERIDEVMANPATVDLKFEAWQKTPTRIERHHDRWSWCDALFMAPPTFARLYEATGDERYLDFMEQEWRATHDILWDEESQLYFRDTRFIPQRSESGKKIFWSRGNGWVYGGLALTLEKMPQTHSARPFLEDVFIKMSSSIKDRQQSDGMWYPNLDDPEHIPTKETSGTAFFTYGMAWGINQGLLSKEEYWPHLEKAWNGLIDSVQPTGMLGYVQPVGASPQNNISANITQLYGTGGFLMAGVEILKALGRNEISNKAELLQTAETLATDTSEKQALASYQPHRKDDIAWENDKMAFRLYGPALQNSAEGSGIDPWMKSVPTPIVQKWYDDHLSGKRSYHQDHGEGYDAYKVGPYRGCGGLAIWNQGKLETSNVYSWGGVIWSKPDEAKVSVTYLYRGAQLRETKTISLRVGDDFCNVESRFWGPYWDSNTETEPLEIAIGLTAQNENAEFSESLEEGWIAIWDHFPNGDQIGTGVIVEPDQIKQIEQIDHGKKRELVAIVTTDKSRKVTYRMGFTWIRASLPKNLEDWSDMLSK